MSLAAITPTLRERVFMRRVALRQDIIYPYVLGTIHFHVEKSYCRRPDVILQIAKVVRKEICHSMSFHQNYIVTYRDRMQRGAYETHSRGAGPASGKQ